MVRKMRYRQVLQERCKNYGKGTYTQQVRMQQGFFKEDNSPNLTISQVRDIHSGIGTWDKLTEWRSWEYSVGKFKKGGFNRVVLKSGKVIYPKADYSGIARAKAKRYMEQEKRTVEFFERMGV